MDKETLRAMAGIDRHKALLRDCLSVLSQETVTQMICDLERDMHESDDAGEKLHSHAALVGVLATMQDTIESGAASDE